MGQPARGSAAPGGMCVPTADPKGRLSLIHLQGQRWDSCLPTVCSRLLQAPSTSARSSSSSITWVVFGARKRVQVRLCLLAGLCPGLRVAVPPRGDAVKGGNLSIRSAARPRVGVPGLWICRLSVSDCLSVATGSRAWFADDCSKTLQRLLLMRIL